MGLRCLSAVPECWPVCPHFGLIFARSVAEAIFPLPSRLRTCADTVIQYLGPLMTPIVAIESSLGEYRMHGDNAQACKRFTEEHVRRLVVSEQEIWRAWRHYLASPSSGLGPDFPILSEEPRRCFPMRTHASGLILSTGRSTRQSLLIFCGRYLCRTGGICEPLCFCQTGFSRDLQFCLRARLRQKMSRAEC